MMRCFKFEVQLAGAWHYVVAWGIKKSICCEDDALAEEVGQDVVDWDILDFPAELVQ